MPLITGKNVGNSQWDDLRFPAISVKLDAVNPPTETAYKGGMVLEFPSNSNKKIYFTAQLPHSYEQGTDIEFHVHYTIKTSGAASGTENVKFIFTHSWANIGDPFPSETTVNDTKDVQSYSADDHILHDIASVITGTDKNISSVLICSLERDVSVADDYSDSVYLITADIHFKKDSLGSSLETSK